MTTMENEAAPPRGRRSWRAPDSGPDRTDYCCTFHWFRLRDGRIVGMDVIRSDDTGTLGLRLFVIDARGNVRALVHEAPSERWEPFAVDAPPRLEGPRDALGRGAGWVAGAVRDAGPGIRSASFLLHVEEVAPEIGLGSIVPPELVNLRAIDDMRVRTTGTLTIDGQRFEVDAEGPCSTHYGRHLPDYAYVCTVPRTPVDAGPSILLASVRGDDLRWGGRLLGDVCVVYALGDGDAVPKLLVHIGKFARDIRLGFLRRLYLRDVRPFRHELEGRVVVTATARAVYEEPHPGIFPWQWLRRRRVDLGRVALDYRGAYYVGALDRDRGGVRGSSGTRGDPSDPDRRARGR